MTNSPRTAGRINRVLAMLPWVIANPGAHVDEVCRRFGYTHAELAKDLNTVFVCGLPGYGPGDLMDATIDDDEVTVEMADYFSRPLRLTAAEMLGLLASAKGVQSAGLGGESLDRAIRKLEETLIPGGEDSVVVDMPEPPLADVLRTAAVDGVVVRIDHTSIASGKNTIRDIEPWSVFTTLGNWYVSGYCRRVGSERVFRIDRIRTATPTGEQFTPEETGRRATLRYMPGDDDVHATIRLGATAQWVAEYYPVEVVSRRSAGLTIRMAASDPLVIARLLLRLGSDATLVEGAEVGSALDDLRSRIVVRYSHTA